MKNKINCQAGIVMFNRLHNVYKISIYLSERDGLPTQALTLAHTSLDIYIYIYVLIVSIYIYNIQFISSIWWVLSPYGV